MNSSGFRIWILGGAILALAIWVTWFLRSTPSKNPALETASNIPFKTPSAESLAPQTTEEAAEAAHSENAAAPTAAPQAGARAPGKGDPVSMPSPLPIDIDSTGDMDSDPPPNQSLRIPDLATIREEVRMNPHQVPPSLTRFARDLARNMEDAKRRPENAPTLFKSLESCVDNEGPQAIRALCYTHAERLSKLYPGFSSGFRELESRTPGAITRLTRQDRPPGR